MIVRVSAPSRLHFGLLSVRTFGGIGLMIDRPGLIVEAQRSTEWRFEGSLADRVKRFQSMLPALEPLAIRADGPPEHTGLGVGTSLGMALAEVWSRFDGIENCSAKDLAVKCGRGMRSGIGVHGFRHGGFVVDHGKTDSESLSLCESIPFPWPVVVITPRTSALVWTGEIESRAFTAARDQTSLHDMLTQRLMPALRDHDFDEFTITLGMYNRIAGEPFASAQGGPYATDDVTRLVDSIRDLGWAGVGQSSWGPTMFVVVRTDDDATSLVNHLNSSDVQSTVITRAAGPACCERID